MDLLRAAVDGDHQALCHAMQALSGSTEAPSHWYAIAARRAKEPTGAEDERNDEVLWQQRVVVVVPPHVIGSNAPLLSGGGERVGRITHYFFAP